MSLSTAIAQTSDPIEKRERVVKAAVEWVYDQTCSNALAELEEAVADLIGAPLDGGKNESSRAAA